MTITECEALIIGGGPAGLAAALELKKLGITAIKVLEREAEIGGVPRLCHHTGFGLLDLQRVYSGPAYAQAYRARVRDAGIEVLTATTVTGWMGDRTLVTTSSRGVQQLRAQAILLATGCRERPLAARLVPGNRVQGVFTTGSLQRFVYERRLPVGKRAVIVGAELVSLSAVLTLAHAGVSTALAITQHPAHQIYLPYLPALWYATTWLGVTLATQTQVQSVIGHQRVEAVELLHLPTGQMTSVACDTVVFTGDWIPEHELARTGGLVVDPASRGPQVDRGLRTSAAGIFAAGNLLRGAQTADHAALEGRHAAQSIEQFLRQPQWSQPGVPLRVHEPVAWISPNRISAPPAEHALSNFVFQVKAFCDNRYISVYQGKRLLYSQPFRRLIPNRPFRLAGHWCHLVDTRGEPVDVALG